MSMTPPLRLSCISFSRRTAWRASAVFCLSPHLQRHGSVLQFQSASYCTANGTTDTESADLYKRLGLTKAASSTEIKQRFFELSKIHHPDTGGDVHKFRKVKESYEVLSRVDKRKLYDAGVLTPDGTYSRRTLIAKLMWGIFLFVVGLKGTAMLCGMRLRDVFCLYLMIAYIASSGRFAQTGMKGTVLTLMFCYTTNSVWAKAVDARLVHDSFTEQSVDLFGPTGVKALVSVWENKKEVHKTEVELKGLQEHVNVPLVNSRFEGEREVRVLFQQSPYGVYRHEKILKVKSLMT